MLHPSPVFLHPGYYGLEAWTNSQLLASIAETPEPEVFIPGDPKKGKNRVALSRVRVTAVFVVLQHHR